MLSLCTREATTDETDRRRQGAMRAMWANAEGEDARISKSVRRLAVTRKKEGKVKEKPSEEGQSIHQGDDDKVYLASLFLCKVLCIARDWF